MGLLAAKVSLGETVKKLWHSQLCHFWHGIHHQHSEPGSIPTIVWRFASQGSAHTSFGVKTENRLLNEASQIGSVCQSVTKPGQLNKTLKAGCVKYIVSSKYSSSATSPRLYWWLFGNTPWGHKWFCPYLKWSANKSVQERALNKKNVSLYPRFWFINFIRVYTSSYNIIMAPAGPARASAVLPSNFWRGG